MYSKKRHLRSVLLSWTLVVQEAHWLPGSHWKSPSLLGSLPQDARWDLVNLSQFCHVHLSEKAAWLHQQMISLRYWISYQETEKSSPLAVYRFLLFWYLQWNWKSHLALWNLPAMDEWLASQLGSSCSHSGESLKTKEKQQHHFKITDWLITYYVTLCARRQGYTCDQDRWLLIPWALSSLPNAQWAQFEASCTVTSQREKETHTGTQTGVTSLDLVVARAPEATSARFWRTCPLRKA